MTEEYQRQAKEIIKSLSENHPSLSVPPDRKWMVEELGLIVCSPLMPVKSQTVGCGDIDFMFDDNDIVDYASFEGSTIATPKTRAEVLIILWVLEWGDK